ncbi:hypothetical protein HG536_0B04850 [Torulaspora globosa]|uniref:ditrans,polycis-polyprenyl diphosphate synthase [(2E,6E)-farnesyldiphosphate specific] n=1 Tax=Torulaspora globosa TaxID=48254 RepID=A0A7G3ZDN5_9SACH|nr:uncharacterized protein HG536_0B04850 [Torulaspora globosa]QLL31621.1 hypothetical protein HG536_0B04850 [Torulaspora globosa]
MDVISESSRLQSEDSAVGPMPTKHIPPAEAEVLKKDPTKTKLKLLKAVTASALMDEDKGMEERKVRRLSRGESLLDRKASKVEYVMCKVLLVVLYLLYGLYRYFQYEYNKMKLRLLGIIYNPSNTPQLIRQDVTKLKKIPRRLAAILEMKSASSVGGGVKGLMNDGSELVCWTVSAGIKHLILYDYDGVLKSNVADFRKEVYNKLGRYYGPSNIPKYAIRIPHLNKIYFNDKDSKTPGERNKVAIEISLLSNRDGRETIVDLTKTMADLCASHELQLTDITMKLVDKELNHLVGPEPDLLLYFGPSLDLQGFPPWHIRLTEFHWEKDNDAVVYSVFIRGLQKYSACKINVGK